MIVQCLDITEKDIPKEAKLLNNENSTYSSLTIGRFYTVYCMFLYAGYMCYFINDDDSKFMDFCNDKSCSRGFAKIS